MGKIRLWRGLIAALVGCGVAVGQVGPPACPAARPAAANPSMASIAATAAAGASDSTVIAAVEPVPNFGVERYRLQAYADCTGTDGCYWADVDAQAQRAEMALEGLVTTKKAGENLALVLDIDETSLSEYCEMPREAFGYIGSMFNAWVVSPEASVVLPGTLRLYNKAKALGVSVFFLTGRPEEQRAATERNLKAAGYADWSGLFLRDAAEQGMTTVAYKSSERAKIVAKGYRLVMSMGDQWSDLNGTPRAEVSVKLPNPFYYLP